MPKPNPHEPWLHEASGFWCKKVGGQLHYLDRDYGTAKRKLRKLREGLARNGGSNRDWLDTSFAALADEFLNDVKATVSRDVYRLSLSLAQGIENPRPRTSRW